MFTFLFYDNLVQYVLQFKVIPIFSSPITKVDSHILVLYTKLLF